MDASKPVIDRAQGRTGALSFDDIDAHPGMAWAAAWTDRVDARLGSLLEATPRRAGVAVVALGSYARRSLCPASDIDVLLLHDGWGKPELQSLVQTVCYPLWDLGLSVGHSVLTPREVVRGAAERVDRATALVDRRLVAGDRGLLDELGGRADRWLRRHRSGLLSDVAEADADRHLRDGPEPGMLEPDLKNGAGGLRDVDSLRWAAAGLLGAPTLDALVGARFLGAVEHRQLRQATEVLLSARCALHLVLGARKPSANVDRLRLDVQDEVAARLGLPSADDLLRRVGLAARLIRHVHGRTWPQLLEEARAPRRRRRGTATTSLDQGLVLVDGLVELADGANVAADPSLPLRAVAAAAVRDTHLGRGAADRLRRELVAAGAVRWTDAGRRALLTALRQGRGGLAALEDADQVGIFDAMLPGWADVRGFPQRNPYHRYDLDTHLRRSVAELVDLSAGAVDPRHAAIAERLDAPEVLLLATFLHDIGKPWPGDHSVVGADRAAQWVTRMGFGDGRAERVSRLVRHHLLLPEVATSRDLDDHAEIARVADALGDTETLDALLLLSLADARATGPSAYSAWKESLLAELHQRVRAHLTGGTAGWSRLVGPDVVVREAKASADSDVIDALLDGVPRRYLFAADAEQVVAHAELVQRGRPGLSREWRPGATPSTAVLTVVAPDRRGLVADCAGVLAGAGLTVYEARAFTRDDGLALDWFVVGTRDRATGQPVRLERVSDMLERLGDGRLDVEGFVARRERRRDERVAPAVADIEVGIERGDPVTRVDVHGPDAPGLLYRLARVLATAGLDVVGARVATLAGEARDVFFVTATDVGAFDDLEARLRRAVEEAADPVTR